MVTRTITVLLTAALLLSLWACGNTPSDGGGAESGGVPVVGTVGDGGGDRSGGGAPQAGPLALLCLPRDVTPSCATEAGYYYLSFDGFELPDGTAAGRLLYMDYATRREVYLCSNAACGHNTEDCTAVFREDEFPRPTVLFVWHDRLYILSKEPDYDGAMMMGVLDAGGAAIESQPAALYQANLDGTGREKVYTFDDGATVEDLVVGDESGLYFVTKKVTAEFSGGNAYQTSSERRLVRVDPATGTETEVQSMDLGDNIDWNIMGCADRELVLCGIDFGRTVSAEEKHGEDHRQLYDSADDVFALLDIDTGELRELYRFHAPKARSYALDAEALYYAADGSGGITRVELSGGAQSQLCAIAQDSIWGIVGDHLYTRDEKDDTFYFIDVHTGEVSHSPLVNKSLGWALDIVAEAGDQVLVIYDYDATPKGDGSYIINHYRYALIDKEDLYVGRDTFRPIEMIGKGE